MIILGIETSCDETGVAIVKAEISRLTILANTLASSLSLHAQTGGIIPEIAAREQIKYIIPLLDHALQKAFCLTPVTPGVEDKTPGVFALGKMIDAIAVTVGPGLIGSLLVGVETARTLAYVWNKPIIPVNHLYGHIYANFVREKSKIKSQKSKHKEEILFPALALVVSGGHTDLVLMKNHQNLEVIGGTRDDAAGEAFDKIGRLLGLPYPAGPVIAKLSEKGDPKAFRFPRPMIASEDFDFSFSGLKTAVLREVKNNRELQNVILRTKSEESFGMRNRSFANAQDDKIIANLCASVQQAIVDVLVDKTIKAAKQYKVTSILLGGGVAANTLLRNNLTFEIGNLTLDIPLSVPPPDLCTDNAAMIASAAYFNNKQVPWQDVTANPELYY